MYGKIQNFLANELTQIEQNGLLKKERIITTPQGANVKVSTGEDVVIMCANNYLGLSSHPEVVQAAKDALDTHGYGMSSVRFICGTQDIHKTLERKIAEFYGTEDTILYAAAFDANGGVFEPLFTEEDAIISDELNHASIIDGIRLCKAARYRSRPNFRPHKRKDTALLLQMVCFLWMVTSPKWMKFVHWQKNMMQWS
jgi:glycine C-acetyltransferase